MLEENLTCSIPFLSRVDPEDGTTEARSSQGGPLGILTEV